MTDSSKHLLKTLRVARKVLSKAARTLEALIHLLWSLEARLTAAAETTSGAKAAELAATLGCVLVDHIHPALEALRKAAEEP